MASSTRSPLLSSHPEPSISLTQSYPPPLPSGRDPLIGEGRALSSKPTAQPRSRTSASAPSPASTSCSCRSKPWRFARPSSSMTFKKLFHGCQEVSYLDRFALEGVESCVQHLSPIPGHHRCGHGHNGNLPSGNLGSQPLGKTGAIWTGSPWHGLRHTWASRLSMAGVDPRTRQELGEWRDAGDGGALLAPQP
jgi:hypothetical protein